MQYMWLNKNNNKNLIVLFNGWAMNEDVFKDFSNDKFDIIVLFDYRNFEFDFSKFDFEKYEKKYLICWSMGVFVSNCFKDTFDNFDKKIAINGTNKIIDNNFGIPKKVFDITIKFLNQENLNKFILNVFDKKPNNFKITRTIEELKEELISIKNLNFNSEIKFDKAIISMEDKIIPPKNQINFWQNEIKTKTETKIEIINAPHSVFEYFKSWGEILC